MFHEKTEVESALDRLVQNDILFLVAVLCEAFGPRDHWPTRQFGIALPPYLEVIANIKLLERIRGDGDSEPDPNDEFIKQFTSKTKTSSSKPGKTTENVRLKRQKMFAKRNKMLRERGVLDG